MSPSHRARRRHHAARRRRVLIRIAALIATLSLAPLAAQAADPPSPCVQALEQIETLKTTYPVYKLEAADIRHFIDDAERAAEIRRLETVTTSSCSQDARARDAEQAAAAQLHQALSPVCAVARDTLSAMELPSAHESADRITKQRQLVTSKCPPADPSGLWLLQWNGRGDLQPGDP
jgi:hypothetical protein